MKHPLLHPTQNFLINTVLPLDAHPCPSNLSPHLRSLRHNSGPLHLPNGLSLLVDDAARQRHHHQLGKLQWPIYRTHPVPRQHVLLLHLSRIGSTRPLGQLLPHLLLHPERSPLTLPTSDLPQNSPSSSLLGSSLPICSRRYSFRVDKLAQFLQGHPPTPPNGRSHEAHCWV
jgi:hypothetical protein